MFTIRRAFAGTLASLTALCLLSPTAFADETITFFDTVFLPTATTISVGETVTWEWSAGDHVLTSGVSSNPADNPGALFEATIDAASPTFSYTFALPGTYSFFDALNETGLVGTIIVEPEIYVVQVVDIAFTPQDVTIFVGDQVRWQWIEGIHTVTSGASSAPADNPGALFDAPNTDGQPVFDFIFTEPGTVPYYCAPHEIFGMTGTVLVQSLFLRGDTNRDGSIDVADPIALLGHLFLGDPAPTCSDAADANDSGALDIADAILALDFLFGGAGSLPAPFPAEGADRTADTLLCL
ncbi:MAG: plastocyanin/azurin family copper-binding protein [Planctomycetota bacterium]